MLRWLMFYLGASTAAPPPTEPVISPPPITQQMSGEPPEYTPDEEAIRRQSKQLQRANRELDERRYREAMRQQWQRQGGINGEALQHGGVSNVRDVNRVDPNLVDYYRNNANLNEGGGVIRKLAGAGLNRIAWLATFNQAANYTVLPWLQSYGIIPAETTAEGLELQAEAFNAGVPSGGANPVRDYYNRMTRMQGSRLGSNIPRVKTPSVKAPQSRMPSSNIPQAVQPNLPSQPAQRQQNPERDKTRRPAEPKSRPEPQEPKMPRWPHFRDSGIPMPQLHTFGVHAGTSDGGIAKYATGGYNFTLIMCSPTARDIKSIDDFFSAFGYCVNRFMTPAIDFSKNIGNNECFYLKTTAETCCKSTIREAQDQFNAMCNAGTRFWKTEIGATQQQMEEGYKFEPKTVYQQKVGLGGAPKAQGYLCQKTGIGNRQHMYWTGGKQGVDDWFKKHASGIEFSEYSRIYGESVSRNKWNVSSINVAYPLNDTLLCDYIAYYNDDAQRWFYGYITNREFVSPNSTRIHFAIDYYATYFDCLEFIECFVERITGEEAVYQNLLPEPVSASIIETPSAPIPDGNLNYQTLTNINNQFNTIAFLVCTDMKNDGSVNNPEAHYWGGFPYGGYCTVYDDLDAVAEAISGLIQIASNFVAKAQSVAATVQNIVAMPQVAALQQEKAQIQAITVQCPAAGKWNKTKNYQYAKIMSGTGQTIILDPKNFGTASIKMEGVWYGGTDGRCVLRVAMNENSYAMFVESPVWGQIGFAGTAADGFASLGSRASIGQTVGAYSQAMQDTYSSGMQTASDAITASGKIWSLLGQ